MKIVTRKEAVEQGLKRYFTGKPCKHGHVSERTVSSGGCLVCASKRMAERRVRNPDLCKEIVNRSKKKNRVAINERAREAYKSGGKEAAAKWRANNPNKVLEADRKYKKISADKVAKARREWMAKDRDMHPDKYADRCKSWRANNPDAMRNWRSKNPLNIFTRKSIERIETATGKDRINRAEIELGYTQKDFKQHIESQFKDGMSWENRSEWHIDHIKPLSVLISEGVTDPAIINALDNLQPLWAKDNLSKGAKFNEETLCN